MKKVLKVAIITFFILVIKIGFAAHKIKNENDIWGSIKRW